MSSALHQAAGVYIDTEADCVVAVSGDSWTNLLEASSVGSMYAKEVGRRSLQATKRVNTSGRRVLLPDSLVCGRLRLNLFRNGSAANGITGPVTQAVAEQCSLLPINWKTHQTTLSDNVRGGAVQHNGFQHVAMLRLRLVGVQRFILQKMSVEAVSARCPPTCGFV